MKEDPRPTPGNDGMHVVLDHRQMCVGARRRRHVRRRHLERRMPTATDSLERVVRRRLRVLDPPVPAAEANVAKRNTGVRRVAVHRPADRKETSRCRAVALPSVHAHPLLADTCDVRTARREPATVFPAHPGPRRRVRRPCGRGSNGDQLPRSRVGGSCQIVREIRGTGGHRNRRELDRQKHRGTLSTGKAA